MDAYHPHPRLLPRGFSRIPPNAQTDIVVHGRQQPFFDFGVVVTTPKKSAVFVILVGGPHQKPTAFAESRRTHCHDGVGCLSRHSRRVRMQVRAPHSATQTNERRALCTGTTKAIANFWRLRTTTTAASVLEHNIDHMHRDCAYGTGRSRLRPDTRYYVTE